MALSLEVHDISERILVNQYLNANFHPCEYRIRRSVWGFTLFSLLVLCRDSFRLDSLLEILGCIIIMSSWNWWAKSFHAATND